MTHREKKFFLSVSPHLWLDHNQQKKLCKFILDNAGVLCIEMDYAKGRVQASNRIFGKDALPQPVTEELSNLLTDRRTNAERITSYCKKFLEGKNLLCAFNKKTLDHYIRKNRASQGNAVIIGMKTAEMMIELHRPINKLYVVK